MFWFLTCYKEDREKHVLQVRSELPMAVALGLVATLAVKIPSVGIDRKNQPIQN